MLWFAIYIPINAYIVNGHIFLNVKLVLFRETKEVPSLCVIVIQQAGFLFTQRLAIISYFVRLCIAHTHEDVLAMAQIVYGGSE